MHRFQLVLSLAALVAAVGVAHGRPSDWNVADVPRELGVEHRTLRSEAMGGRVVGYNVFLPPGYAEGKERYPVVYYLHGKGGTERDTARFAPFVRRAIEAETFPAV